MEMQVEYNNIPHPMASLQPFLQTPSPFPFQTSTKSKNSISILKSRQLITEFENTLDYGQPTASLISMNRQVNSGLVIDFKNYEPGSQPLRQLVARSGEDNEEPIILSFMVFQQEEGKPSKVVYRWIRRPPNQSKKTVTLREEQHIYKGQMRNDRKHGEGEYLVLRKWTDTTETQLRYRGRWYADVFSCGTFENEKGQIKEVKQTNFTTFKSKGNIKEKVQKNLTIRKMAQEIAKKKAPNTVRDSNASCISILNNLKHESAKDSSSIHTIRL